MWCSLLALCVSLSLAHNTTSPTTHAPSRAPTAPTPPTTSTPTSQPTTGAPTVSPTISWEDIDINEIERNLTCGLSNPAYRMYADMPSPICIVISDTNYTMFYPVVDDFTLLEIDASFNQSWLDRADNLPVYVRVEVGHKSSPWRMRSSVNEGIRYTVPYYTVIIETLVGIVSSIYWDDSCFNCDPTMCVSKSCGVATDGCQSSYNCNLQIYVGWFGTDSKNGYMTSAGKRLSRFRGASLHGAVSTALTATLNLASNAKPIGT